MMKMMQETGVYEEVIRMCMCNIKNGNCMYGVCTSHPGAETPRVLLQNKTDNMIIEYKLWVITCTSCLMTVTQQSDKLTEYIIEYLTECVRYLNHPVTIMLPNNRPDIQNSQMKICYQINAQF